MPRYVPFALPSPAPGKSSMKRLPCGPARVALAAVLAVLLGTAAACSSLAEDVPPVDDSVFVEVLIDLHLAEARDRLAAGRPALPRDSLLARHGIEPATYRAALAYYAERPDAFHELYGRVLDRLHTDARGVQPLPTDP